MHTRVSPQMADKEMKAVAGDEESLVDEKSEVKIEGLSPGALAFTLIFNIICLPIVIFGSWFTVEPRQEVIVLYFGRVVGVTQKTGVHFYPLIGRELRVISLKQQTIDMKRAKIIDRDGSPLIVDGVIMFRVTNALQYSLEMANGYQFVANTSQATLKAALQKYTYDELIKDHHGVCAQLRGELQARCNVAGVEIVSTDITDLSYSPEIAQAMLASQQAKAMIKARKLIVEGAVGILDELVAQLAKRSMPITEADLSGLMRSLLLVITADQGVTATMPLSSAPGIA